MNSKDFFDVLLPGTKVRVHRELFHFVSTIDDCGDVLYVFKKWNKYSHGWSYKVEPKWFIEYQFDFGALKLE